MIGAGILIACALFILWQAGLPAAPDFSVNMSEMELIALPVRGGLVPPFHAQTLNNENLQINETLNHPLILNFWATWCVPCVEEMPVLERLSQQGVAVIGVNVGLEDQQTVSKWVEHLQLTFPIVIDDELRTLESMYRITAMPTTFFVDSDGIIRYIERGQLSETGLKEGLIAIGYE